MKSLVLLFLTSVLILSCSKDDSEPSNPFGIDYSFYKNADKANGFIIYQNYGGPRIDLTVDSAFLLEINHGRVYQMCYFFTGHDSLKLTLEKFTSDYNYHSDASTGQNKILFSVFNNDTIDMVQSALSLQPRTSSDDFSTVLNLHSADNIGTFNGTIDSVVLIR
jgi:hypothetical protein